MIHLCIAAVSSHLNVCEEDVTGTERRGPCRRLLVNSSGHYHKVVQVPVPHDTLRTRGLEYHIYVVDIYFYRYISISLQTSIDTKLMLFNWTNVLVLYFSHEQSELLTKISVFDIYGQTYNLLLYINDWLYGEGTTCRSDYIFTQHPCALRKLGYAFKYCAMRSI